MFTWLHALPFRRAVCAAAIMVLAAVSAGSPAFAGDSGDLPALTFPAKSRTIRGARPLPAQRMTAPRKFEVVGRVALAGGAHATAPKTPLQVNSASHMIVNDDWAPLAYNTAVTVGATYHIGIDAFAAIQPAIDAVSAGGTVDVLPGSYSETAANSFLYDASGPYTFGLFFSKAKGAIKLRGVTATGAVIASAAAAQATIKTNSDANFGPDGFFVEGDGVTISGIKVSTNTGGTNKTIEVIGNDFTLKNCQVNDNEGSVYINDWQFDTGTNTSYIQKYRIEGNIFQAGNSVDISSGAGLSGPASGRVITGNQFNGLPDETWPMVSFNGSNTGVPWFVYSVGGAVITGNTFNNSEPLGQHIRARGTYDNSQFDWASYWNSNSFDRGVVVGSAPPATLGTFSYPNFYGTFTDVRRIGSAIQPEVDHGVAGDIVLAKAGVYQEKVTVSEALTLKGANAGACAANGGARGPESTIDGNSVDAAVVVLHDDVTIDGFEIIHGVNGLNAGVWMSALAQNMSIKNNIITDNTVGVYANCAGASDLSCNLISANNAPGPAGGTGIYSEYTASLDIQKNEITGHIDNNPVIFAATGPGVHTSLNFASNNVHANELGIFALAIHGGLYSGNTITTGGNATALTFGGDCSSIVVSDNFIDTNLRGVRVNDYGYVSPGANSSIKVNHNNLVDDTEFAVGVLGGYSGPGQLDAACNWYGSLSGPNAPLNPSGTGSPVTGTTAFYPWLDGSIAGAPLCNQTINWTITSAAGAGGSISPLGAQPVADGSSLAFTMLADPCYQIADVKVDGVSVGAVANYTFTAVTSNHTIDATFALIPYTISASAGTGGTISAAGGGVVAYDVTAGTAGNQTWEGELGMDFDVTSAVSVTQLGAFDSGSDGLASPISVRLYDRDTQTLVPGGSILFGIGEGTLIGGSRFKTLPGAIALPAGFHGTIVADGYNASEPNGNTTGGPATLWSTNGGGAINFVGSSRYDNAPGGSYPNTVDTGPVNRYAAGTFMFDPGTVACGDSRTYNIAAEDCYSIAGVEVDGVPQGPLATYTFTNVTSNHTIVASFSLNGPYTITTSAGAGGSIAPANPIVACGADQKFAITADACYSIASITVDGNPVAIANSVTLANVQANHTLAATFALNGPFTITTLAGSGGSLSPANPSVACGADQKIAITPDPCYSIASVTVDGSPVAVTNTVTFTNVQAARSIEVTFALNGPYTITTTPGAGGSISPSNPAVACGTDQKIDITPDACYSIASVTVDGSPVAVTNTVTFTNVQAAHSVEATFALNGPYTLSVSTVGNGSVSKSPDLATYACGSLVSLTATADPDWHFTGWSGDASGMVNPLAVTMDGNKSITATFAANTHLAFTLYRPRGLASGTDPTNAQQYVGHGSWHELYPSAKSELYISPTADLAGAAFTVNDIQSVTYHTYNHANVSPTDFYLTLYTAGSAHGWYEQRITAEPYLKTTQPYVPVNDAWQGWTTGGADQLTFNDTNNSGNFGFYGQPTLAQLQSGPITWNGYPGNPPGGSASPINYGPQGVLLVSFQTGSGWSAFDGYLDGITIALKTGTTYDVDLEASPYTLTTNTVGSGTVTKSPDQPTYEEGAVVNLTATPAACYEFTGWSGDASGNVNPLSVTMDNDKTITATFALSSYTITALAGAGGTISPASSTVACGADQKIAITADDCYSLATLTVDGNAVALTSSYTFTNVQANHTIEATFSLNGPYLVTTTAGTGGTITPANPLVACGASQKFDIAASDCYTLVSVTVDGSPVGAVSTYTLTNVHETHVIEATFSLNGPYTISTSAGPNGTITATNNAVACGSDQKIEITPDDCYSVATLIVDGNPVAAATTYTFSNVHGDHTIAATFSLNGPFTITTTAGPHGTVTPVNPVVACGADQKIAITADAGYGINTLTVDGNPVAVTGSYTFTNVHANHTIAATFKDVTPPVVTVVFPNGHENFLVGSDVKFVWIATDNGGPIATVKLSISRNNGADWTEIAAAAPNGSPVGSFVFTMDAPGTNTDANLVYSALFKVEAVDADGNPGSDTSDNPFSIFDLATAVVLTQLDAEQVDTGIQIKWALQGGGLFESVELERSANEVGPWLTVAADVRDDNGVTVAIDRSAEAGQKYWYRLVGTTTAGARSVFGPVLGTRSAPREFALSAAWPVPSRGTVRMEFAVAKDAPVHLSVLDLQGREVTVLADGVFKAGRYQAAWDGKTARGAVPAGVYFARFEAAGKQFVRRIVMQ